MKNMLNLVGLFLIILGTVLLTKGFHSTEEKLAQIGSVEVTADIQKNSYIPPILGSIALIVGIVFVVTSRRR
jgi:hypothetical protein